MHHALAGLAALMAAGGLQQGDAAAPIDPAADIAAAARVNAEAQAQAAAQTRSIRRSQEDYARAQAAFARDQAKRRNDVERAEAAARAEAYRLDVIRWKESVAVVEARNARLRSRSAENARPPDAPRPKPRIVCAMERPTGSTIPQRVCRPAD